MTKKPGVVPRNPLVAPALFRKAGKHGKTTKAQRRLDQVQIQRQSVAKADGDGERAASTASCSQDVVAAARGACNGNRRAVSRARSTMCCSPPHV